MKGARYALALAMMCTSLGSAFGLELTVWEDTGKGKGISEAVQAFTRDTGISVRVEELRYIYSLERLRLDGPIGKGPDVLLLPSDQLGFAESQGMIDPVFLSQAEKDSFHDEAVIATTYKSDLYSIPKTIETLAFFCNRKMIDREFEYFDDYYEYSLQMKKEGHLGLVAKFDDLFYATTVLSAYDAEIFGTKKFGIVDPEDIRLSSDQAVRAVEDMKRFYDSRLFPSAIQGSGGLSTIIELFCSGKAAVALLGTWDVQTVVDSGIDFNIVPLPKLKNGRHLSGFIGVRGYAISHWAKDYEAALLLAKYLTDEKYAKNRFKETGEIPAHKALLNDPEIKNDRYASPFIIQAQYAKPCPSVKEINRFWLPSAVALNRIYDGKVPVKEGLEELVLELKKGY
ncbi:MAG: extracellular solute-binding protein [Succinivibrio sp.]